MAKSIHRVSVVVDMVANSSPAIQVFQLKDKDGWELPPFTAGSHVDVHLPSGKIRQYSLCGDPNVEDSYQIAVKREESGRGGSREMHDSIKVGQELLISLPRNTFPMLPEVPIVMIAGGIGITAFMSALTILENTARNYHLHYCVKSPQEEALLSYLSEENFKSSYTLYCSQGGNKLNIDQLINAMDPDTHLYCCGPAPMIENCEKFAEQLGNRLHVEHFGANLSADAAYEVKLQRSGRVIPVAAGQTMLQALRLADIDLPASCEAGICLDCKCRWLGGDPVHRELTMPKDDRSQWITPCVSGCDGPSITLDL